MAFVGTYLNFEGQTEEAFAFYGEVFGTEPVGGITRMGDMPAEPGQPPLAEGEERYVAHMRMPIIGGHVLMGSDMLASQGHRRKIGNSTTICIELSDRAEADRLWGLLSDGSTEGFGMADMPWGAYWGTCLDRFGTRWMLNCTPDAQA